MPLQESVPRSPAGELLTWIARLSCSEPLTRLYLALRCTDCATTRHREAAALGESILNNSSRPYKVVSMAQKCMRLRPIVRNTRIALCCITNTGKGIGYIDLRTKVSACLHLYFSRGIISRHSKKTTRLTDRRPLESRLSNK